LESKPGCRKGGRRIEYQYSDRSHTYHLPK